MLGYEFGFFADNKVEAARARVADFAFTRDSGQITEGVLYFYAAAHAFLDAFSFARMRTAIATHTARRPMRPLTPFVLR